MTLPEPTEWECVRIPHESLSDACRRLYPFAVELREGIYASNVDLMTGVVDGEIRDEIAALDAFLNACRAAGLEQC